MERELKPRDLRLMLLASTPVLGAVVLLFLARGDPKGWQTVLLCLLALAATAVILIDDYRRRAR